MTAVITKIADKNAHSSVPANTHPELASVAKIDELGRIKNVNLVGQNTSLQVIAQAKHITRAINGDSVLVQYTAQGYVVLAQLAEQNDSPAAVITDYKGHVKIQGEKSVTLQTDNGTIEVHKNGNVVLEAKELTANSERDLTLAGWPIRLN